MSSRRSTNALQTFHAVRHCGRSTSVQRRFVSLQLRHDPRYRVTSIKSTLTKMSPEFDAPILFICDMQERFREGIHEFKHVTSTTQKVLKASKILKIPICVTTQLSAKLGSTISELRIDADDGDSYQPIVNCDKTKFSMWTPEVIAAVAKAYPATSAAAAAAAASASTTITSANAGVNPSQDEQQQHQSRKMQVALVGIETHICVSQTARDLMRAGHTVYVLADGVSSINKQDRQIALARLRHQGAIVTTSEAWIFEVVGDAKAAEFREISALVRESKAATTAALTALCDGS